MVLFLAFIMATPHVKFKEKARVLIIGEPMFFLLNIARLYLTILCGYKYGVNVMNLLHKIVWEVVAPVVVIAAWLIWLYSIRIIDTQAPR